MKSVYYKLALFSVIIVLIGMIRFNRNDFAVPDFTERNKPQEVSAESDAVRYIALTNYYRSNINSPLLIPPYTTRVLIPFAAACLPFAPDTSINIINIILTIGGLFLLYYIMVFYGLSSRLITLGFFVYAFSFPVFYYMTITYVDASFIFFIYLSLLFILKNRFLFFLGAFILGSMVKETMIIIIPVYFIYGCFSGDKFSTIAGRTLLLSLIFASVFLILRFIRPDNLTFFSLPHTDIFFRNISRPRTFLSFIFTFGVSGFASLYFLSKISSQEKFKKIISRYGVLIAGMVMGVLVWVYSVFSAYPDGRFIWITVPFTIPLMLLLYRDYRDYRLLNNSIIEKH